LICLQILYKCDDIMTI